MVIGAGIILATVLAVFTVYFGVRSVLEPDPEDRTRDLATSVVFRISSLHGLVLALVFASEVVEYHSLAFESANEVNAISDAYYDAVRYGDEAHGVRAALREYVAIVPSEEWRGLGKEGDLSPRAWAQWNEAYRIVLDLTPVSPRQVALRDNMLRKIHLIAENRDLREYQANAALSSFFWAAALIGVLLVSVGFYIFPSKRDNLVLLTVFSAYTGLILFTIYAMSNPFSDPAALEPVLFFELSQEFEG
ncbi:DUF4239 domain-containing protein [Tropicimonas sp. IMCC6043]|uniref:bestrophin-like domain n=1 Tax=Tropicimonas sp. IMCC6043 TaxID=2510645 RepID=UPI00101DB79F|nr:DUF4239 domain-containing protein [Tropicimonas sp. IMCC6043]RYH07589.1 DUF4239 domain-containing protein [Tropicimonas sp. IMCC6043]